MYKELNPYPDIGDVIREDVDAVDLAIAYYFMTKKRQRLFAPERGNTLSSVLYELDVDELSADILKEIVTKELPQQVPVLVIDELSMRIEADSDNNRYYVYMPYAIRGMEVDSGRKFKAYLLKEQQNG